MLRLLQSSWVVALVGAAVYGAVTLLLVSRVPVGRPVRATAKVEAPGPRPSWNFVNPELGQLVTELNQEKEALANRAKQLDELEARLAAERAEISVVTQAVYQMQREFDRNLVRVREEELANLKRLAKTYAIMTPEGAAKILKEMEDDQIVKLMLFMKEKESAPLLETLAQLGEAEVKRVAVISERLRTALFREPEKKP